MKRMRSIWLTTIFGVLSVAVLLPLVGTATAETKKSHLFPAGYCTWYVADRNDFYTAYIKFNGNAGDWITKAQGEGYKTKDRNWKPKKYSVAVTNESVSGHVALVKKIEKDKNRFLVTDMNYCSNTCLLTIKEHYYSFGDSRIKGFVLTKKAVEEYQDDDKSEYKTLKAQYQKHDIWFDGARQ